MSSNNVKRLVSLAFSVLLVVCSKTVFAQQKNWQYLPFSEQQSKKLATDLPTNSIFGETENLSFEDSGNSFFYLPANTFAARQEQCEIKNLKESTPPLNSNHCEVDLNIKRSFNAAPLKKEFCDQELLSEDNAENLDFPVIVSSKKSFQHFRPDIYPNRPLDFKSVSFNQSEAGESEKDKPTIYSGSQSAKSFYQDAPDDKTAVKSNEGFRWQVAIQQSLMFLAVQHGYALTQAKTRRELKGNFFNDYVKSVKSLRGWADGGRFFTNYIAHPLQGSFTGFIQIQNDPKGLKQRFGGSADYWRSRAKALAWSAAWSTQFEIGPLSQASIGNVGLKGKQTYVDLVMTPLGGTAMIIGEDAIDRFVMRAIERRTNNFYAVIFSRMLLSPTRTIANLFRFKTPWYRDRPRAR